MKISDLEKKLKEIRQEHGDQDFLFDFGADTEVLKEEDINFSPGDGSFKPVLRFYAF